MRRASLVRATREHNQAAGPPIDVAYRARRQRSAYCIAGGDRREDHAQYESSDMTLLNIFISIAVVGVALWAINRFIPMDSRIKSIVNAVVLIGLLLWLLQAFGVIGSLRSVRVGVAEDAARSMQRSVPCNLVTSASQLSSSC